MATSLFLLRWAILSKSLWYDEIYTVSHYAGQSWDAIVAGDYSPNNHILSSLLIKASEQAGAAIGLWQPLLHAPAPTGTLPVTPDDDTLRFRLPTMLAGVMAALALAWPLRAKDPGAALGPFVIAALIAGTQPWLLAFSTEARGYALALALGLLATNILHRLRRWNILWYALAMAAAIYTIPLAGLLLAGHGLAILLLHRQSLRPWLAGAGAALVISALLYAPFYAGIRQQAPAMNSTSVFPVFLTQTLRCGAAGWNTLGIWSVGVALLMLAGLPFAWKQEPLRVTMISFGATAFIALALPLAWPALGQPRFIFWLIPLLVIGSFGWITRWRSVAPRLAVAALLSAWVISQIVILATVPPSPALDAIEFLAQKSPPDARIVGVYMGTLDACLIYETHLGDRSFYPLMSPAKYDIAQDPRPGHTWYLVVYPEVLHARMPELESKLHADAECVADFPGRIEHVQVFRKHDGPD